MRLLRVRSAARTNPLGIAPWGDPVGDVRVLGLPLVERQERAAHALGLRFEGEVDEAAGGDALYWDDDIDVSVAALREFLKGGEGRMAMVERPSRKGALEVEPAGPAWEGEATRLIGLRRGASEAPVVVRPRGISGVTRTPGPFRSDVPWFVTARTATTVRHWVHVLRANLSAIAPEIDAQVLRRPWRPIWAWMRRGGARWTSFGKRCRIHPTARLEGCVLGDGVEVGAFSVLRGCIVGDGARIEDHVTAKGSVVEPGAHLGCYCMFNLSVLGACSSISHIGAQASIVGRDTFIATFATLQDLNLAGNIRVPVGGTLIDTGSPFLGCAVGHRVRMGAHVSVAPGRAIPNDVTLVGGAVLTRPPDGPGLYPVT